jgi:transcription elongation factor GreA
MESIPITTQGFDRIKLELDRLKAERPEIIQAIKEAREEGDLRENAGYEAARERQGMLEARITYIESRMHQFNVIDLKTLGGDRVTFGATVEIEDLDSGERKRFTLLGPDESDYNTGIISVLSPVGRALIGKEAGDEVLVEAPKGQINYEIVSVAFNAFGK